MKNKLLKAINTFGVQEQSKHFSSEAHELAEAINEYEMCLKYAPEEAVTSEWLKYLKDHIAEEISDCYNFLEQFRLYYGIPAEQIKDNMVYKMDRTDGIIDEML